MASGRKESASNKTPNFLLREAGAQQTVYILQTCFTIEVIAFFSVHLSVPVQLTPTLFRCTDPYIETWMNWVPIIVICSVVGSILVFVVLPLMLFACIKSRQRREEKTERREVLIQSLHASRESLASIGGRGAGGTAARALRASRESLDSLGAGDLDDSRVKKRRPPVDLSLSSANKYNGASIGPTGGSDSYDMKPVKYDLYRPTSQLSSVDFASTKWDEDSTFDDSDLAGGARGGYHQPMMPPMCENEISNVNGSGASRRPLLAADVAPYHLPLQHQQQQPRRREYDDDASVSQSLMGFSGSGSRRPGRPAPMPNYSAADTALDEVESVASSRPSSDASGTARSEGRTRPPRPRLV